MKLVLKDYQESAVAALVTRMSQALRDRADGDLTAVVLSAPTGSGKTVIATAAIETVLFGTDIQVADPKAVFLWVTDQPELNEQTRRKMLSTGSKLRYEHLEVIDESSFDQEKLSLGRVYFINTQKLGANGSLVRTNGDKRSHTFWQTMTATIADPDIHLFVVIDEAHRGMTDARKAKEAQTIVQKFLKGSPGEMPASPIIIGISATAQNFEKAVDTQGRTKRSIEVLPTDVRGSGLIKERIVALVSDEQERQAAGMTMLAEATRQWRLWRAAWADYGRKNATASVQPLLLVQVEDGSESVISKTDLAAAIETIRSIAPDLSDDAFAHAFQQETEIIPGPTKLRHIRPADIADEDQVEVVFFKTSLNTGWDCPRAEVMISFRPANDFTNIAQLIGRMVRTPLGRRIDSDERLNSVMLYLPNYNRDNVAQVIKYLTDSGEAAGGAEIEFGTPEDLARRAGAEDAFAAIEQLPRYVVPKAKRMSDIRRLVRLARALSMDRIAADADEQERARIVGWLADARDELAKTPEFRDRIKERGTISIAGSVWSGGDWGQVETSDVAYEVSAADVDLEDLFAAVGRKLGEGLHKDYRNARLREDRGSLRRATLELVALAGDAGVLAQIELLAAARVQELFDQHHAAIKALPIEARRQAYEEIRGLSGVPSVIELRMPDVIPVPPADRRWKGHLYVADDGLAPFKLLTWEAATVAAAMSEPGFIGWLRNIDRKHWALAVPYELDGTVRPMYPDFLVVRSTDQGLKVDILDPHNPGLEDSAAKARGLAHFAERHGSAFGRIWFMAEVNGKLRYLDLKNQAVRERVFKADTPAMIKALFEA